MCKLNPIFYARDKVVSTATKRIYDCKVPPGSIYIDCHCSNVIYLITCNKCFLQYVGETAQSLNARFNGHRTGIKNPEKHGFCRILAEHFNHGNCKGASYKVQILEKLEGNGRTARGALDASQTSRRKARELYWTLKLRTVFPYGLNDRVGDEYKSSDHEGLIGKKFPPLSRKHQRFARGSHNTKNNCNPKEFVKKFLHNLKHDLPNILNFSRVSLLSMNKSSLKQIVIVLNEQMNNKDNENKLQWITAALDIIESKIYKAPPVKPKRKPPNNLCKVLFDNKAIEYINLPRIFHEQSVKITLPSNITNFDTPTVVYNLESPMYSKIFNFNKFVSQLDIPTFLNDNTILPCNCAGSEFIDDYHQHILTGNLKIIKNDKLRLLFRKGPKFRETKPINWDKARTNILVGINKCISDWCSKHGHHENVFNEWKSKITESIDSRINILSEKITSPKNKLLCQDQTAMQHLKDLHNHYVITPIDKASGNVAIICKRFYARVLIKELELDKPNGAVKNTYLKASKTSDNIINNHKTFLKNKFNITIDDNNKNLPHMYWLPKLHKKPSKSRFIVAATNCSVKPLSKAVTAALKLLYNQIESYNDKCFYFSGVKSFWPIQDNSKVINSLNRINNRSKAKTITTFDFSTLYTSIPHDKLKNALREVINFGFKGGDKFYIGINKYGAKWVQNKSSCAITFDKSSLKLAINFLLDQCYFNVGNLIFRQVIGIPMGSDPAPFMANLFLYFYENKWLESTKKHSLYKARKFSNVFRFIDDLCAINDNLEFKNNFKNIYPPELELKQENISLNEASFLDLSIKIADGKFHTCLYDKRDAFPFSIVRMPYLSSNMPSKIFYASVGSEILRLARTNTSKTDFIKSVKVLLSRMEKQGCKGNQLKKVLNKMYGRHVNYFQKFARTANEFIGLVNLK